MQLKPAKKSSLWGDLSTKMILPLILSLHLQNIPEVYCGIHNMEPTSLGLIEPLMLSVWWSEQRSRMIGEEVGCLHSHVPLWPFWPLEVITLCPTGPNPLGTKGQRSTGFWLVTNWGHVLLLCKVTTTQRCLELSLMSLFSRLQNYWI